LNQNAEQADWPTDPAVLPVDAWTRSDLAALDRTYEGMYKLHRNCHEGIIAELGRLRAAEALEARMLEVACGTGWNIKNFVDHGFEYSGLDISERAISIAMMRNPRGMFFNLPISNAAFISEDSFDLVYCASMLEHLDDFRPALRSLIRIARRHLFVVFFEGLKSVGDNEIQRYPFSHPTYFLSGQKFCDLHASYDGQYFWNRYSLQSVAECISQSAHARWEVLDSSNRGFLSKETIVHVVK
jgi:SAM-dependent methyltransferase